ncbi:MAG: peptide deformylase [Thermodesulfobacteriota bacterium]
MDIVVYPDPILKEEAEPVLDIDQDIQDLITVMGELMYSASGIGLAANQVGIAKRIFVYDLDYREKGRHLKVMINPSIVLAEDRIDFEEGCLSVPDFLAKTARSKYVKAEGLDSNGNPLDIEAEGLLAVCIQHEIDHLNGTLILDHASRLKRNLYKKRIAKLKKKDR